MRGSSRLFAFIADIKYFYFPVSLYHTENRFESKLHNLEDIWVSAEVSQLAFSVWRNGLKSMSRYFYQLWKFWPGFWGKLETQPCFLCCLYSNTSNFVIYFVFSQGFNLWLKMIIILVFPGINITLKLVDFMFLEELGSKGATQALKIEGK